MGAEEGPRQPASSFLRAQLLPHHDGPLQHTLSWQRTEDRQAGGQRVFSLIQDRDFGSIQSSVRDLGGVKCFTEFNLAQCSETRVHNRKYTVREEVQKGGWQWV